VQPVQIKFQSSYVHYMTATFRFDNFQNGCFFFENGPERDFIKQHIKYTKWFDI